MLLELQRTFHSAVLGQQNSALASHVAAPRGTVTARIDVYRNTVQTSLTDVLATAFPVVQRIVGPAFFAALTRAYIAAAPPRAPQLSGYGATFAPFIAAYPDHGLAYLPDVARLEWARGEAYFAANASPLEGAALMRQSNQIGGARLALHPATRLIRSPFPIMTIWHNNQPEVVDVPAIDMTVGECALITRPAMTVTTRQISAAAGIFVDRIADGAMLETALAAALTTDPAFDFQAALEQHLRHGTFRAAD